MGDSAGRAKKFREYYINRETEVLIEEYIRIGAKHYGVGYNREYVRFAFESPDNAGRAGENDACCPGFEKEDLTGRILTGTGTAMLDDETVLIDKYALL